jgi:hypothetical protein
MEKPTVDTPVTSCCEHAAFTVAAVAADPETVGMEGGLETTKLVLKQEQRALEDHEDVVKKRLALFKRADAGCDHVLRSFQLQLFGLVRKDTDHPRYRRYFKDGLRAVTEAEPRRSEPTMVAAMIVSLGEDLADPVLGELAAAFLPRFKAALAQVKATEQALAIDEASARHRREQTIPAAKLALIDEYVKLHGALRALFPREAARVEACFLPFRKERKKADEASPEPAPPPSAPPS